jgi:HAD superfamily hydrolase (TIGR01509 family)
MVNGVLLDLDGTLIDSNEAHARAWTEALSEAGVPVDYADVRVKIGEGGDHLLPELTGISAESELGKKIKERRSEIFFTDYLPRLKAFPGARALLKTFSDHGLRYVAATSATKKECELLLRQAKLDDLVKEYTSSDDAEGSKPDPDILYVAMEKIQLPSSAVMMLGDTPYDLKAAQKAGMKAVAFTCGGWPKEKLSSAVAVYQGPWELLAAFDRSPFASRTYAA